MSVKTAVHAANYGNYSHSHFTEARAFPVIITPPPPHIFQQRTVTLFFYLYFYFLLFLKTPDRRECADAGFFIYQAK
jgi:hypothetical protein